MFSSPASRGACSGASVVDPPVRAAASKFVPKRRVDSSSYSGARTPCMTAYGHFQMRLWRPIGPRLCMLFSRACAHAHSPRHGKSVKQPDRPGQRNEQTD
eukprot:6204176-Pleurochrysis_carterae.AAC.4